MTLSSWPASLVTWPPGFLLPGTDSRPADVLIPHRAGGSDTALHVEAINPLLGASVEAAAGTPGYNLQGDVD